MHAAEKMKGVLLVAQAHERLLRFLQRARSTGSNDVQARACGNAYRVERVCILTCRSARRGVWCRRACLTPHASYASSSALVASSLRGASASMRTGHSSSLGSAGLARLQRSRLTRSRCLACACSRAVKSSRNHAAYALEGCSSKQAEPARRPLCAPAHAQHTRGC